MIAERKDSVSHFFLLKQNRGRRGQRRRRYRCRYQLSSSSCWLKPLSPSLGCSSWVYNANSGVKQLGQQACLEHIDRHDH
jgi:hypothetical protein